jgi:hypothetical protein
VWKQFDDDRDEDYINLEPVTYPGYDFVASMNVGLSMLVLLKKWSAVQVAVLLLLPTLVARLSKVAEYLLPTESGSGWSRLAVISLPLRSVGPGVLQASRRRPPRRGLVFNPATRSSFRSRHPR